MNKEYKKKKEVTEKLKLHLKKIDELRTDKREDRTMQGQRSGN